MVDFRWFVARGGSEGTGVLGLARDSSYQLVGYMSTCRHDNMSTCRHAVGCWRIAVGCWVDWLLDVGCLHCRIADMLGASIAALPIFAPQSVPSHGLMLSKC